MHKHFRDSCPRLRLMGKGRSPLFLSLPFFVSSFLVLQRRVERSGQGPDCSFLEGKGTGQCHPRLTAGVCSRGMCLFEAVGTTWASARVSKCPCTTLPASQCFPYFSSDRNQTPVELGKASVCRLYPRPTESVSPREGPGKLHDE